ncbi:tyrosine-type recombinase/integrase [Vagococcus fluvialis]|uniref:tyrosine-type recombinase/integrase n=1 Tax=Vagococcus fluvialis TaxID=2738 RepID=UPI003B58C09F
MAQFTQYELKNGSKKWMFKSYLGVDEVTGKEIRTTRRGFDTLKEAKLEEKRLQHDYLTKGFQKAKVTTFKEAYEMWFTQYKNTVKESTWAKTGEMFVNHILPAYGDLRIDKIDVKYCQKIINKWFDHTKSKYKRMHDYTSSVFEFAISIGIVSDNPTKKVTVPKVMKEVVEETEFNYYSKEELIQFLDLIKQSNNEKAYSLFYLLAFTGLRQGEALALTWSDIDFELKTLTVNKTLTRGENSRLIVLPPKTKKSARTMALDDGTLSVLKSWRKTQRTEALQFGFNTMSKNQLIFTNIDNNFLSPAKPRKWLIAIQDKHNLKSITVHGFRHTHCSLLFEAGANIQEVQERLGHTDVKTTMNIYTHVTKKTKKETALKFANYINIV